MKNNNNFTRQRDQVMHVGSQAPFSLHNNKARHKFKTLSRIVLDAIAFLALSAILAGLLHLGYFCFMRAAYPVKYNDFVTHYANMYGFEPSLAFAIIRTESGFDSDAVSHANALGLMQITRDTFDWAQSRTPGNENLPHDRLFDPETNIQYGLFVLSLLREEFSDTHTMLAAYNAGIGNVRKWLKDSECSDDGVTLKYIPYNETRCYVKKVPTAKKIYEKLYDFE
ncbi:MAG: lytic transglycosylase domain-containing protein [Oscillospiraceae bacterium]|nr:lytic transglycosylase domain-containing protein [Oscillospiraceae bacterium]